MKTTNPNNTKTLYIIFGVIVVGLIFLIIWFAYLLWKPNTANDVNTNSPTNTVSVNTNTGITDDADDITDVTDSSNTNKNINANVNSEVEDEGLVEPDENDTDATEDTEDEAGEDDEKTGEGHTLYFASSNSACGEVIAVEREWGELGDDPYGEIILTMMAGPEADENGVDGIPSTVRLRRVEYTADGPLVTVNEGYDELDECAQQTIDKQFIETANAMFDLPEGTAGEVVVGTVEAEEIEEETETETE